jgi:hypothetical protein
MLSAFRCKPQTTLNSRKVSANQPNAISSFLILERLGRRQNPPELRCRFSACLVCKRAHSRPLVGIAAFWQQLQRHNGVALRCPSLTVNAVFRIVLYRFAATGVVPASFDETPCQRWHNPPRRMATMTETCHLDNVQH